MKGSIIATVLLGLVLLGAGGLSIYKYEHTPKLHTITVQDALQQRNDALAKLQTEVQVNKVNENEAAQKVTTLCAQLTAAKLKQPLCE